MWYQSSRSSTGATGTIIKSMLWSKSSEKIITLNFSFSWNIFKDNKVYANSFKLKSMSAHQPKRPEGGSATPPNLTRGRTQWLLTQLYPCSGPVSAASDWRLLFKNTEKVTLHESEITQLLQHTQPLRNRIFKSHRRLYCMQNKHYREVL